MMKTLIENYKTLLKEIGKIIDYPDLEAYGEAVVDETDMFWTTVNGVLYLSEEDSVYIPDNEECWSYEMSSYLSKREKFYMGEKDEYTFIMAFDEQNGWDSADIKILLTENRR